MKLSAILATAVLVVTTATACVAAPAPASDKVTNWQDATDAAIGAFVAKFDPNDVQAAASACGNKIRAIWAKKGSYSTTYSQDEFENFEVEVYSIDKGAPADKDSGCKVTAK